MSEPETGLARLMARYKPVTAREDERSRVHREFSEDVERISAEPEQESISAPGSAEVAREMTAVQEALATLAEKYGKLNVNFGNLIKKMYTGGELFHMAFNRLTFRGKKNSEIRISAAGRRAENIDDLVDSMAKVLESQFENAKTGVEYAQELEVRNMDHIRSLDRRLIDSLKQGRYSVRDQAEAGSEVNRIQGELQDIDAELGRYESLVQQARAENKLDLVHQYTDEMGKVLDLKYEVMQGKRAADGIVSEIRREMLDSAEGVQAAKGALAASKVNAQAIALLKDAMSELEIKYRHAMGTLLETFKIQGAIAAAGSEARKVRKTLYQVAGVSAQMMGANASLVMQLGAEVADLLQQPSYDVKHCAAVEQKLSTFYKQLTDMKMKWANKVQESGLETHYAKP